MKTWKLVSGILSIIFSVFVFSQAGMVNFVTAIEESGDTSGGAGLIVSVLMLAGGIVSIVTRKSGTGGKIATLLVFGLAALIGMSSTGIFGDLQIWGGWCLICAIIALISLFFKKKAKAE